MFNKLSSQTQRLLESGGRQLSFSQNIEETNDFFKCPLCSSLTYKERFIGWGICFSIGLILSMGSTLRLIRLLHGHPGPFSICYSIGNIVSIISSMFFVGPKKQIYSMFHKSRRGSTIIYLTFILVTIILCIVPSYKHIYLHLLMICLSVMIQGMALVWYTLSYVPYGRQMFWSCCKKSKCYFNRSDEI